MTKIERAAKKVRKDLDAEIDRFFYTHGHGVQINIFDLSKISQAGRDARAAGEDVEAAVLAAIAQYRKN